MRVGVIGVGRIGQYHARLVQAHPDVDHLVVTDADPARAREIAAALGVQAAPDVAALLRDVDAVVIASTTATHAALIRQAVDAGVPTFCEKPIALDLASTSEVVRHVRDSGIVVQIGFQRRFDAGYRAARDAVRDGTLGRVYIVRAVAHDPAPPHESYLPGSGGMYRDLHIHDFDIARWVIGQEIVEVFAQGAVLADPMFARHADVDTSVATLAFGDGALGVMTGGRHDPGGYDVRMEILGSGDSIAIGWDARTPIRSLEPGLGKPPAKPYESFFDRFDAAYRAELSAFIDVARGRIPNPCGVEDAEVALRVALACARSRDEHRPVRVEEIVA